MGRKDILFNEDLEVLNGDFSIQESDQQHINHIMRANKGHYYQFPLIGLGGVKLINMSKYRTLEGQNIFDVVLQNFGSLDNLAEVLIDNPLLNLDTNLFSGQILEINSINKGNLDIKNHYIRQDFKTNNQDENFLINLQTYLKSSNGNLLIDSFGNKLKI